jgi:hypothetical protein
MSKDYIFCYKYECNALGPKGKVLLCCHIIQVIHHDLSRISKCFFYVHVGEHGKEAKYLHLKKVNY